MKELPVGININLAFGGKKRALYTPVQFRRPGKPKKVNSPADWVGSAAHLIIMLSTYIALSGFRALHIHSVGTHLVL